MKLIKLVKLGETRNLLGFGHKQFLNYFVQFLSWEWLTSQDPYPVRQCPWPCCKPCWSQNTSWCQCCLHFLNFILLSPIVFYCIMNKLKVWGNSNFKAYYLHLDFMGMVRVLDRSQVSGTHPTFWGALTSAAQLGRKCQWSVQYLIQTLTQTCWGPNFPPTTSSWKDLLESWHSPMHVAQLQWHSYPAEDTSMTPTFHQCICSLQDPCSAAVGTAVSSDRTGVPMCPQ